MNFKLRAACKIAYESLSNPDVAKRDYDAAQAVLSQHAADIWRYICKQSKRTLGWDLASVIGPEVVKIQGDYSEFVTEIGEFETRDNPHYKYTEGFPTELLLSDDWQSIVDKHIVDAVENYAVENREKIEEKNKIKKASKVRQKVTRQRTEELQRSVLEKTKDVLTEEEYEFLVKNLFSR